MPERARYTADGQLLARSPVRARMRYDLVSVIAPAGPGSDEEPAALRRALRRPPGFNARTVALAEKLRAASSSDAEVVTRAIALLREGGYAYTLEPPLLGADSVDEFLFDTRAGFCEHFSSAFVFMMRAAGVPSRTVLYPVVVFAVAATVLAGLASIRVTPWALRESFLLLNKMLASRVTVSGVRGCPRHAHWMRSGWVVPPVLSSTCCRSNTSRAG